ncbi:PEP/pyruvate-binding domain-containing protein [Maridesulfovibrio sp. FT414]|uniref:PEP/pyruvate-binding domain-containing protein n=1 Tax=Maridesulfovibrio sp. FT414 TaxID=2979469 RepID=UPI003D809026
MRSFINAISRIIRNPSADDRNSTARFLERCNNFRLLLSANNSAMKRMAGLFEASQSPKPVGMTYLRAENIRISSDVRNMIERLNRIAPGRYEGLREAFNRILAAMNSELVLAEPEHNGPFILNMAELGTGLIHEAGSKMAVLGEIASIPGIRVPKGFSITASAFRFLLKESGLGEELKRVAQICGEDSYASLRLLERNVRETVSLYQFPPDLEEEITAAAEKLAEGRNITLAVRSSALCEDGSGVSFAGQFHTELGVAPTEVVEAYRNVVASIYTVAAMTYRLNHGIRDDEMVMCVGCMEMVDAVAGGVAYSCDPSGLHAGQIVVSAVRGLPSSIVDGIARSDLWRLDRDSLAVVYEEISDQEWGRFLSHDGSIVRKSLGRGRQSRPAIEPDVLMEICRAALALEEYFKCPQDVEWALTEDGALYILQSRPLEVMKRQEKQGNAEFDESLPVIADFCQPASPGIASGTVHLVQTPHDMIGFPSGGILLTRVAGPELAALLPRAAAVVAEYGSSTGHLANVAREYGIPALIGVPGAVAKLKGILEITVDAINGRILLGCVDQPAKPRELPFKGTPVSRAFKSVLKYITPLNLTDPRSSDFTPEKCMTLHDITRFCHEKAVAEMFKGRAGMGDSARQMLDGEKLQYWIIDIGGGLAENGGATDCGYVRLEDIRSSAMKALWTGMTGFPWEGPPDICLGGFASVLFGATCNPALVPGVRNSMGERSYFIVGSNYCCLQTHMGFHYCTIEGFAGRDPEMNYVLFQFKGGAADMGRRSRRLQLVADILSKHAFHTSMNGDVMFARMEGISPEMAKRGLTVAGYLLVQTRQLDMVMDDSAAIEKYRARFDREIESLIFGEEI